MPAKKSSSPPKRGRPSKFSKEVAAEICQRVSDGESLRSICREKGKPAPSTVRSWVLDNIEGFTEQYERAGVLQAHRWAEEIFEISDDSEEETARSRLRVDARKWMLSKMLPKVYGDKIDISGKQDLNVTGANLVVNLTKPEDGD